MERIKSLKLQDDEAEENEVLFHQYPDNNKQIGIATHHDLIILSTNDIDKLIKWLQAVQEEAKK